MKKLWIKGALPDGCAVENPKMQHNKCLASFHAYSVGEVLQYGMSGEVLDQLGDFGQWLLGIAKHGGPEVDGKPLYDPDTALRIWETFIEKTNGKD